MVNDKYDLIPVRTKVLLEDSANCSEWNLELQGGEQNKYQEERRERRKEC